MGHSRDNILLPIVYAAQANGMLAGGRYAEAQRASKNAATWCWVSFGAGVLVGIVYLIMIFAVGMTGFLGASH
jgi:hypothetical protein